jgi:hypothetical protein
LERPGAGTRPHRWSFLMVILGIVIIYRLMVN